MAKCFIIMGRMNKKLFLPLIAGFIQIIYNLAIFFDKHKNDYIINNTTLNWLVFSVGQMLVRLYPLILKIANEPKSKIKITKKKKFLHYFFLCLIFVPMIFLGFVSDVFQNNKDDDSSHESNNLFPNNNPITICFEMIFLICISICFLKYKYFKHHIISLIFLILIGIFFFVFSIEFSFNIRNIGTLIYRIPHSLVDAIYRCYQKYLMEKFYYPYWNIAFVPGITFFPIALFLFIANLKINENNVKNNIEKYLSNFIIFKIVIPLVFNIIICPLTILVVYYFSPDYILIITLLASISETITFSISNKQFYYINILLHIIQIFFMMIYLEILELNFCGLNKNTRRNIHLRSEIDLLLEHRETIYEDNNIDINKNYILELEDLTNENIKTEEED